MKEFGSVLLESIGSSIDHYNIFLNSQGVMVKLRETDTTIRSKLI